MNHCSCGCTRANPCRNAEMVWFDANKNYPSIGELVLMRVTNKGRAELYTGFCEWEYDSSDDNDKGVLRWYRVCIDDEYPVLVSHWMRICKLPPPKEQE